MGSALPTFDQVVDLIRSPKPPLACRVLELSNGDEMRSARVIFDGMSAWFIESDEMVEFRIADDLAVFDEGGELKRVGPGMGVHSNPWVKTAIQGERLNLDEASGHVIRREVVDGRPAILVEVIGLRAGEDTVFELQVDLETGVILRMSRPDLGPILRVDDLRIGTDEDRS